MLRWERDHAVPQPSNTACRFWTMKLFSKSNSNCANFKRYCSSVLALLRYNLKMLPLANYKAGFASLPTSSVQSTIHQKALISRQWRRNSSRSEHISVIPHFHDKPEQIQSHSQVVILLAEKYDSCICVELWVTRDLYPMSVEHFRKQVSC